MRGTWKFALVKLWLPDSGELISDELTTRSIYLNTAIRNFPLFEMFLNYY